MFSLVKSKKGLLGGIAALIVVTRHTPEYWGGGEYDFTFLSSR